jgi:signal peptidase II
VVGGAILLVGLSLFGFDFDTEGRRQPDPASDLEGRRTAGDPEDAAKPASTATEADIERD